MFLRHLPWHGLPLPNPAEVRKNISIQMKLMNIKYQKVSVMLSAMACASVCEMAMMRGNDETCFLHDQ